MERRAIQRKRRRLRRRVVVFVQRLLLIAVLLAAAVLLVRPFLPRPAPGGLLLPLPPPTSAVDVPEPIPDWVEQDLLPLNPWSRPGTPLDAVNGIVIHYVGNPNTTAQQNRSYYNHLAQTHEAYVSSHFVIGMDGTVIQCVPLNEVAYCSNDRNNDTISIECCHPDASGQFTGETYEALIKLTVWLMDAYVLERADILRHYDVTGKECPRWFVEEEGAWEEFLDAVTSGTQTSSTEHE